MGAPRGGDSGGGGVKVIVRTRPANQFELKEDNNKVCFNVATTETCMLQVQGKNDPYTFTFDNVFGQDSRQIEVFEAAGIPTVDNVLAGYNSTIFAYGQTGAGKTHTMVGNIKSEEMRGLTPRVFEYLFQKIEAEQKELSPPPEYKVICSNLEIYNETITDLLTPGSTNLQLRNDTKLGSGTYVDGLKEVIVANSQQALDLMEIGTNSRTVASTNANLTSSRSHCVFTCVITRKHKRKDGSESNRISRLNLVDLAGSERAKVSDGKDAQTLKEGCNINKSLTCLGRVIKELVESQRKGGKVHVPYRDSKLTSLLQESLGGNARTTIIAGVSPMFSASGESLSTLQFVQRAKHIKNKAKANEAIKMDAQSLHLEVLKLRSQIEKMKREGFSAAGIDMCSGEPDPEVMEKLQREEERCQDLENQLEDIRMENEHSQVENRKLENEISVLRNLKAELQNNITDMMDQFNAWQQKIGEAEEITKKVFEAERQAIMDEIESHKKRISVQESEKQQRDAKIEELTGNLTKVMTDLDAMKISNEEITKKLDAANNNLNQKNLQIDQLNKDYTSVSASLKESEASCADLDKKLADANALIKSKTAELQSLQAELDRARSKISDVETDNSELRQKIDELENNKMELKKKISETEMTVQKLESEKRELQSEIEMVEHQRTELEAKVAHYVELSKKQREEATQLKAEFEQRTVNFQEQLDAKDDEFKRAQANFEAQLKAREARLAETARQYDEEKQRLMEEHESNIQDLKESIEDLTTERDRKIRQHKEEVKEWETRYKNSVEDYEDRLEENEKRHSSQFEELQAAIRKKENELRDTSGRLNADIASLQRRLEEEVARYESETVEREKSMQDILHKQKKETKHKVRALEDTLHKYKTSLEDKDSTIEYLERKYKDLEENADARLKKETAKLKYEIEERKAEFEAVSHASDTQVETLERKLEETKKKFHDELQYREQTINRLEEQLGEKDEFRNYLEDYNCQLHRYSQLNSTLYNVLEGINNTLAEVDGSRPPSVASTYLSTYEERYPYDYDMPIGGYSKMASSMRYGNDRADSAFQSFAHSDYARESLYNRA